MRILLVEDNIDEIDLARIALQRCGRDIEIAVATNGRQALEYILPPADAPDLVLLDINLPILDGFGVLEGIRAEGSRTGVPVVVLTTSTRPADVSRALALGARQVHNKAADFDDFVATVRLITDTHAPAI